MGPWRGHRDDVNNETVGEPEPVLARIRLNPNTNCGLRTRKWYQFIEAAILPEGWGTNQLDFSNETRFELVQPSLALRGIIIPQL
jgi:hypothetical protein